VTSEDGGLTQDLGLTDLRLALTAQDGTWHFSQAAAGTNLGVLAGAQSMRVPTATRWPAASTPLEGVMSWRVDNLATLAPWLPPGWRAGGTLTAGASLGGRFGAPELSGTLGGAQLSLRSALEGVDLRDGELQLAMRGQEASIQRFVFKGGAGELRLEGGATFGPGGAARLSVDAKQFQMLGRVDRRIVTSGRATAIIKPDELQIDGRFTVDEGLIDLSRRDAPKLDDDVSVVRSDDDKQNNKEAALFPEEPADDASSEAAARRGPLSKTRLNVQLDLGPALRLKGRGINTRLAGTLAITSPANRIAVNGSVRAESGTYTAYGQNLVIKRGVIRFTGPVENPQLDIAAGRDNLDVEVGVAITGSTQNPRVRLTSEPEMNDIDKLSWLILGRAPDGLGRADTALLQRAALALWAGEEGSAPSDTLLKTLGLDEFSVRQTDSGDARDTVIRVGKQISRRWYIGYERGVNASTGTWQVIYRVAQRLTVRAQSGSDNSLDMIWSWRWK
jgi:translocation and assembly module TamB